MPFYGPGGWQNLPAEITAIQKAALDYMELPSELQVPTNPQDSDFVFDFPWTIFTNKLLPIKFPVTADVSNARITFDNETTYFLIKDTEGNQLIGTDLSDTAQNGYFDGTDFLIILSGGAVNDTDVTNTSVVGGLSGLVNQKNVNEYLELKNNLFVRAIVTATDTEFYDGQGNLLDTVVGANPTSILFDDSVFVGLIDMLNNGDIKIVSKLITSGASTTEAFIFVNADTTPANYATSRIIADAGLTNVRFSVSHFGYLDVRRSLMTGLFSLNNGQFTWKSKGTLQDTGDTDTVRQVDIGGFKKASVANVTSLDFSVSVNAFTQNTEILLMKVVS